MQMIATMDINGQKHFSESLEFVQAQRMLMTIGRKRSRQFRDGDENFSRPSMGIHHFWTIMMGYTPFYLVVTMMKYGGYTNMKSIKRGEQYTSELFTIFITIFI